MRVDSPVAPDFLKLLCLFKQRSTATPLFEVCYSYLLAIHVFSQRTAWNVEKEMHQCSTYPHHRAMVKYQFSPSLSTGIQKVYKWGSSATINSQKLTCLDDFSVMTWVLLFIYKQGLSIFTQAWMMIFQTYISVVKARLQCYLYSTKKWCLDMNMG